MDHNTKKQILFKNKQCTVPKLFIIKQHVLTLLINRTILSHLFHTHYNMITLISHTLQYDHTYFTHITI